MIPGTAQVITVMSSTFSSHERRTPPLVLTPLAPFRQPLEAWFHQTLTRCALELVTLQNLLLELRSSAIRNLER
jgi:hypothetical protein